MLSRAELDVKVDQLHPGATIVRTLGEGASAIVVVSSSITLNPMLTVSPISTMNHRFSVFSRRIRQCPRAFLDFSLAMTV